MSASNTTVWGRLAVYSTLVERRHRMLCLRIGSSETEHSVSPLHECGIDCQPTSDSCVRRRHSSAILRHFYCRGTMKSPRLAVRRAGRPGTSAADVSRSLMYAGEWPISDLWTSRHSLNSILCLIGNQCKSRRAGPRETHGRVVAGPWQHAHGCGSARDGSGAAEEVMPLPRNIFDFFLDGLFGVC